MWSGADPELRNSGGASLLIWEALKLAHRLGKPYNFGGSMVEPIETFMRKFGGRQVQYLEVSRAATRRMRLALAAREAFDALRGVRR